MAGYNIVFRQRDFTIAAGITNVKSTLYRNYNGLNHKRERLLGYSITSLSSRRFRGQRPQSPKARALGLDGGTELFRV